MTTVEPVLLAAVFFGIAVLYSSVGNAGASGYLAATALAGMAPDVMKPTALLLNIIVSAIATVRFQRAGYFSGKIFWPFTVNSVPFALVGGAVSVPSALYSARRWRPMGNKAAVDRLDDATSGASGSTKVVANGVFGGRGASEPAELSGAGGGS